MENSNCFSLPFNSSSCVLARKNNLETQKIITQQPSEVFRVHSKMLGKSSTTFQGNFDESQNKTARSMSISYPYPVENCLRQVLHKELTLNLVR